MFVSGGNFIKSSLKLSIRINKKLFMQVLLLFCLWTMIMPTEAKLLHRHHQSDSKRPCQVLGFTRTIDRDGCAPVAVRLNGCKGHCLSYTIPDTARLLLNNRKHMSTTYGRCCRMTDHELVEVSLECINGLDTVLIPSATECECFDCTR